MTVTPCLYFHLVTVMCFDTTLCATHKLISHPLFILCVLLLAAHCEDICCISQRAAGREDTDRRGCDEARSAAEMLRGR